MLPRATAQRIAEVVSQDWGDGLVRSWGSWIELPERAGDLVGRELVGAAPGQVVVCDSTTVNLYKLACAALDARPGRPVMVTDDDNFPTDRYVLDGIARRHGAELRMIHTDLDEGITPADVAAAVGPDTALVSLSHVAYRSGALADMAGDHARSCTTPGRWCSGTCATRSGAVPVRLDADRRRPGRGLHLQVPERGPRRARLPLRAPRPAGAAAAADPGLVRPARPVRDGPQLRPGARHRPGSRPGRRTSSARSRSRKARGCSARRASTRCGPRGSC